MKGNPPLFGLQVTHFHVRIDLYYHSITFQVLAGADPMVVALGISLGFGLILYLIALVRITRISHKNRVYSFCSLFSTVRKQ